MSKRVTLLLIAVLTVSILITALLEMTNCPSFPITRQSQNTQSDTENFTYELPNYTVNYKVVKLPPPDWDAVNPYAYNIVVYGPPPFPIQIEFYHQNWDNIIEKSTHIMPTNAISTSIGCISYPTQITMMRLDNDSVSPTPAPKVTQPIPKPSVPTFNLKFNNVSYTEVESYTGVSRQVNNSTVDIIIKNQPFTTIYNAETHANTSLYYNVQVKGHYAKNWNALFDSINYTYEYSDRVYTWYDYPVQSNSDYTVISLPALYSIGSKVDFCVQAVIANETIVNFPHYPFSQFSSTYYTPETVMLVIQTSDWSAVHTLNIEEDAVTVTTAPNTSPPPSPTKYTPPPTPSPAATPTPTPSTEPTSPPTSPSSQEPLLTSEQKALTLGLTIAVAVLSVGLIAVVLFKKPPKH